MSSNSIMLGVTMSPNPLKGAMAPALRDTGGLMPDIAGPWLLDYDDVSFDNLVDDSGSNEIYHGNWREHTVAIKKLSVRTWGEKMVNSCAQLKPPMG